MPGQTRQAVTSRSSASLNATGADESSLVLAALLNDLTSDRLPILGTSEVRGVGVSALEGTSLAERGGAAQALPGTG